MNNFKDIKEYYTQLTLASTKSEQELVKLVKESIAKQK
jgi:hypothetical protein